MSAYVIPGPDLDLPTSVHLVADPCEPFGQDLGGRIEVDKFRSKAPRSSQEGAARQPLAPKSTTGI
jgi:hypothetical protein